MKKLFELNIFSNIHNCSKIGAAVVGVFLICAHLFHEPSKGTEPALDDRPVGQVRTAILKVQFRFLVGLPPFLHKKLTPLE